MSNYRVMVPAKFVGAVLHHVRKGRVYKYLGKAVSAATKERDAYVIDEHNVIVSYPSNKLVDKCCCARRAAWVREQYP